MDIRTISDEDKQKYINRLKDFFTDIRKKIDTLEIDIESEDLMVQTSAVWISGNLAKWFDDFMYQIKHIHKQKDEIQNQMMNSIDLPTPKPTEIVYE